MVDRHDELAQLLAPLSGMTASLSHIVGKVAKCRHGRTSHVGLQRGE
ncbi:hypothetical protein [Massilia sp. S19_KUP03_FR1]